jgi:hypothetical protein
LRSVCSARPIPDPPANSAVDVLSIIVLLFRG